MSLDLFLSNEPFAHEIHRYTECSATHLLAVGRQLKAVYHLLQIDLRLPHGSFKYKPKWLKGTKEGLTH